MLLTPPICSLLLIGSEYPRMLFATINICPELCDPMQSFALFFLSDYISVPLQNFPLPYLYSYFPVSAISHALESQTEK